MADALVDLLDERGAAIHPDYTLPPSGSTNHQDIAPWLEEQPTPSSRSRPRTLANSISLLSLRQKVGGREARGSRELKDSNESRDSRDRDRNQMHFEPVRWPSIDIDARPSGGGDPADSSPLTAIPQTDDIPGPRKSKSSIFSRWKRPRSKSRMSSDSVDVAPLQIPPVPPLNLHSNKSYQSSVHSVESTTPSMRDREKDKNKERGLLGKKIRTPKTPKEPSKPHEHDNHQPSSSASSSQWQHSHHPPPIDPELKLDTNLDSMEGIVDPAYAFSTGGLSGIPTSGGIIPNFDPSSPSSAFDTSSMSNHSYHSYPSHRSHSHSDHSVHRSSAHHFHTTYLGPSSRLNSTEFSNPFSADGVVVNGRKLTQHVPPPSSSHSSTTPHVVSPKTRFPPSSAGVSVNGSIEDSPSWTPPQSWSVQRDGEDKEEGEYSSSDEDVMKRRGVRGMRKHQKSVSRPLAGPISTTSAGAGETMKEAITIKSLKLRIYRANGTYHVVTLNGSIDVATMIPKLKERLLGPGERESYKLYLREHSRERLLGPQEKPMELVLKRLGQAGYEPGDIIIKNENLNFILKFIYKSQRLGPAEDEFTFDEQPDMIDLTNRGLRTIPVKLHQASEQIVRLVLSCNPMLEIPLDFIQSCVSLRDLHLSNMSMKRVPQSVKHATSLLRLDLSKNRISNLSDALLDNIPTLQSLNLTSNRLENLPWYLPRMSALTKLDVANNKLRQFPTILLSIENLESLDLSFNQLEELPNNISKLKSLTDLRVAGNAIGRLPVALAQLRLLRNLDVQRNRIVDLAPVFGRVYDHDEEEDGGAGAGGRALETLCAAHNSISALDLSVGPVLKMDVSYNDITQLSCSACSSWSPSSYSVSSRAPIKLTELKLSYAKLSSIDETTLGSLPSLQSLYLNHNSFTSLPESLGQLKHLSKLVCSDNKLTALPECIGQLECLKELDAHNNSLTELPVSIWNCASLEVLNLTSNLLGNWHDPPLTVMRRGSSADTVTGNEEEDARDVNTRHGRNGSVVSLLSLATTTATVTNSITAGLHYLPPLAHSLKRLYLGENRLIDEVLHVLMVLKSLKILNLSFNEFQDMPVNFFTSLSQLEELYLSGNKLTSLPTEDLPKLWHLKRLYLNGNKLQTLPQELGKVKNLMVLDVGSNLLKYNINNWEFDWNWNFNKNLKYLNLSGNKRLQIKSDKSPVARTHQDKHQHHQHQGSHGQIAGGVQSLAGFTDLSQLRVLGLMDVTMTTTNLWMDIPDENDDRRVRTSSSVVNGMSYGIADALGRNDHLNIVDLVHEFRGQTGEAIFAMFGVAQQAKVVATGGSGSNGDGAGGNGLNPNHLAKFVRDRFVTTFVLQLNELKKERKESVKDAMRRTFLRLNQELYDNLQQHAGGGGVVSPSGGGGSGGGGSGGGIYGSIYESMGSIVSLGSFGSGRKMSHVSTSSSTTPKPDSIGLKYGATGVALYFVGKTLYVANVGDSLAVVSRQGSALLSSRRHEPFDPKEMEHIRATNGWVSIDGRVNDDVDTSRSFGFYNHLPIINARPDITIYELTPADEFVIVANRSLWDYVSHQTAVDIARTEPDPMIASQKLRDFAMSYGAEGSIMIMVIGVADLFGGEMKRKNTSDPTDPAIINIPRKSKPGILDRDIARLDGEVPAPTGHVALVFTDIRNSTHLWEVNPGMPTAMRLHNSLLRRQLRLCGGYEVKTEGDAFMCSFPTTIAAVWWCLTVQDQLLCEAWPLEILECEDGKEQRDSQGRLIARGLSVRMGIHCGTPVPERDPITNRMDYFGPVVNRSARVNGCAQGGHIMCSSDVMREINASVLRTETETEYSKWQPQAAIDAISRMGVFIKPVGEVKLKGLELPELLTVIFPSHLRGRAEEQQPPAPPPTVSASRVQLSWEQVRDLGMECLRLETLSSGRIFKLPSSPELGGGGGQSTKADVADKEGKANEKEEEKSREKAERYLVVDPKLVLPLVNDKSTDEQLMMALDSLSVRIDNASRAAVERFCGPPTSSSPALQQRLQNVLANQGGLDERTLTVLLNALQEIRG